MIQDSVLLNEKLIAAVVLVIGDLIIIERLGTLHSSS